MSSLKENQSSCKLKIEDGVIISVLSNNVKSYIHELKFEQHHKPRRKKYCFLCGSQTNSLFLILGAYVMIFLIASIILILSVLKLQNITENDKFNVNIKTSDEVYKMRYGSVLKQMDVLFSKALFKEFMWPFRSSAFNCSSLNDVTKFNYLTSGWTKNVFSFKHNEKNFALKTVNIDGVDMKNCMEKHTLKVCFEKASSKIYKEYILSKELTHFNIVKVLAWCVSSSSFSNNVAIITELCSPIDVVALLRMSFHQRLKIMLDLSQLMAYLSNSPLGSVAINDFQRQQFVMCGNTLKLTDLDDLSIEEPKCNNNSQCSQEKLINHLELDKNHTKNFKLQCINNFCSGYNERQNVINTYKHFVNLFLNITAPPALNEDIEELFNSYTSGRNAEAILKQTQFIYSKSSNSKNGISKID